MKTALAISGWTQAPDALGVIVPDAHLLDYALAPSLDAVADLLPVREVEVVVGWSLGGLIARRLIQTGALKARALISLAAPFQFVRDARTYDAMPTDTFTQFYTNYREDTHRTITRFMGLIAHGDLHADRMIQSFSPHETIADASVWLPWLDVLRGYSAHDHVYDALPPTLIVHGKNDAVVNFSQAELLHLHLPKAQLYALEGAGHAPHLHDAPALRAAIERFMRERL